MLTDDDEIADRGPGAAQPRRRGKYEHLEVGFNSRLDTLQAVVLRAKLRRLAAWNAERRGGRARYDALLADAPGVRLPAALPGNEHVWHLYVVRVADRDRVLAALQTLASAPASTTRRRSTCSRRSRSWVWAGGVPGGGAAGGRAALAADVPAGSRPSSSRRVAERVGPRGAGSMRGDH